MRAFFDYLIGLPFLHIYSQYEKDLNLRSYYNNKKYCGNNKSKYNYNEIVLFLKQINNHTLTDILTQKQILQIIHYYPAISLSLKSSKQRYALYKPIKFFDQLATTELTELTKDFMQMQQNYVTRYNINPCRRLGAVSQAYMPLHAAIIHDASQYYKIKPESNTNLYVNDVKFIPFHIMFYLVIKIEHIFYIILYHLVKKSNIYMVVYYLIKNQNMYFICCTIEFCSWKRIIFMQSIIRRLFNIHSYGMHNKLYSKSTNEICNLFKNQ